MASCAGGGASSPVPIDQAKINQLATDLHKCVKKDQLVKAKFLLKGLRREDKRKIVLQVFDGNAPLFIAAQQGLVCFVNYLLEECGADIEQRGVYEVQEDRSRHQVTPLWCAAVANKLEVVKTLIKHGADINATSDTQSTPVRSACFMTNIEVVKYLVDNGANIHKPNINGGTCLINSVQSVDLCRYLIEKNADANAQDNSGNLALHYAIREGRMETVKLLLKHGSDPYMVNDFGDDAIHTASLRGYQDILDYLLNKIKPPIPRQIEAYELMGTNFVDEKHDILRAIQAWRHGMDLKQRFVNGGETDDTPPGSRSRPIQPQAAYQSAVEMCSLEELEEISSNPDAVYMQSLLIRERILGPDHKDTIFGLMYRGAVYADTHRYQRCVDLWKYAFQLRHEKNEPLNHECLFTLQALCKLFWEIFEEHTAGYTNEAVQYLDVMQVLEMATKEIEGAKDLVHVRPIHIHQQEEFHLLMLLVLHLIHLLTKMPKTDDQVHAFKRQVHWAVGIRAQGLNGKSLLHLAVDQKSSNVSEEFYSPFPDLEVMEVLLECGAAVNGFDSDHSTPLHVCAEALLLNDGDVKNLDCIINCLLNNGAHVDAKNKMEKIAGEELARSSGYKICLVDHVTLKCHAARAVRKYSLPYEGEVPVSLLPFLEMH